MDPRYCFDCRWLQYVTPSYRCVKSGASLGRSVLGKQACGDFELIDNIDQIPRPCAHGPINNMELDKEERELLIAILEDRLGTLREQIYHAEVPAFKDELRRTRHLLAEMILRLKEPNLLGGRG